jgi:hypothetical protein
MSAPELMPLAPNASDAEVMQRLITIPKAVAKELATFSPERAASDVLTSWFGMFRAYGISKTARIFEEKVRASRAFNELLRLDRERRILQETLQEDIDIAVAERRCRLMTLWSEAQDALVMGPISREVEFVKKSLEKAKLLKELGHLNGNDQSTDFISGLMAAQRQYDQECADIDAMPGGEIHKAHLKAAALARFQRTSGVVNKPKESYAEQFKRKMDLYKEFERQRDKDIAEIMAIPDVDEAFKNREKRKLQSLFEQQVAKLGL